MWGHKGRSPTGSDEQPAPGNTDTAGNSSLTNLPAGQGGCRDSSAPHGPPRPARSAPRGVSWIHVAWVGTTDPLFSSTATRPGCCPGCLMGSRVAAPGETAGRGGRGGLNDPSMKWVWFGPEQPEEKALRMKPGCQVSGAAALSAETAPAVAEDQGPAPRPGVPCQRHSGQHMGIPGGCLMKPPSTKPPSTSAL